jgi:hypothetical protein
MLDAQYINALVVHTALVLINCNNQINAQSSLSEVIYCNDKNDKQHY